MKPLFTSHRFSSKATRAFTLIELLLVLVILGILSAVIVPRFIDRVNQANITKTNTDIKSIEDAVEAFYVDTGRYPNPDEGLFILTENISSLNGWSGPYLKYKPDAWGNDYEYQIPGQYNPTSYDILSAGIDETFNTDDDLHN